MFYVWHDFSAASVERVVMARPRGLGRWEIQSRELTFPLLFFYLLNRRGDKKNLRFPGDIPRTKEMSTCVDNRFIIALLKHLRILASIPIRTTIANYF